MEAEFSGPWSIESLPGGAGYGLYRAGESPRIGHIPVVGRLVVHDPAVLAGLHILEGLMRAPMALALLLEACGKTALERVGAILAEGVGE